MNVKSLIAVLILKFMFTNSCFGQVFGLQLPNRPQPIVNISGFADAHVLAVFREASLHESKEFWLFSERVGWKRLDMSSALDGISRTVEVFGSTSCNDSLWLCLSTGAMPNQGAGNRVIRIGKGGTITVDRPIPEVGLAGKCLVRLTASDQQVFAVVKAPIDEISSYSPASVFKYDGSDWVDAELDISGQPVHDALIIDGLTVAIRQESTKHVRWQFGRDLNSFRQSEAVSMHLDVEAHTVALCSSSAADIVPFMIYTVDLEPQFALFDTRSEGSRRIEQSLGYRIATLSLNSDGDCLIVEVSEDELEIAGVLIDDAQTEKVSSPHRERLFRKRVKSVGSHRVGSVNSTFIKEMPIVYWTWVAVGI